MSKALGKVVAVILSYVVVMALVSGERKEALKLAGLFGGVTSLGVSSIFVLGVFLRWYRARKHDILRRRNPYDMEYINSGFSQETEEVIFPQANS